MSLHAIINSDFEVGHLDGVSKHRLYASPAPCRHGAGVVSFGGQPEADFGLQHVDAYGRLKHSVPRPGR